jgi:hypothetical protein
MSALKLEYVDPAREREDRRAALACFWGVYGLYALCGLVAGQIVGEHAMGGRPDDAILLHVVGVSVTTVVLIMCTLKWMGGRFGWWWLLTAVLAGLFAWLPGAACLLLK